MRWDCLLQSPFRDSNAGIEPIRRGARKKKASHRPGSAASPHFSLTVAEDSPDQRLRHDLVPSLVPVNRVVRPNAEAITQRVRIPTG